MVNVITYVKFEIYCTGGHCLRSLPLPQCYELRAI